MFFADFKSSISDYSNGYQLLNELKLWRFALVPAIIAVLVACIIIYLGFELAEPVGIYMSEFWPFGFWENSIRAISNFIGGALVIILGFMIYKNLIIAFSSPFMSPISEKIEWHLNGQQQKSEFDWTSTLTRSIRINTRNILLEFLISIPLLLLSFIPVLSLITSVLLFITAAFYAGFGNLDYTLERHKNYSASIKLIKNNKGLACGNGTVFMLILMIPIVGVLIALPLSTAASTVSANNKIKQ